MYLGRVAWARLRTPPRGEQRGPATQRYFAKPSHLGDGRRVSCGRPDLAFQPGADEDARDDRVEVGVASVERAERLEEPQRTTWFDLL